MAEKNLNLFGTYLRSGRTRYTHRPWRAKRTLLHLLSQQGGTILYRDLWKLAYKSGIDEAGFSSALRDLRRKRVVTLSPAAGTAENPTVALSPTLKSVATIL
jgi:hypothetical protein